MLRLSRLPPPLVRSKKGQPLRAPAIGEPQLHRTKQQEMSWQRPAKILPPRILPRKFAASVVHDIPFMLPPPPPPNAMSPSKAVTSGQLGSGGLGSAKIPERNTEEGYEGDFSAEPLPVQSVNCRGSLLTVPPGTVRFQTRSTLKEKLDQTRNPWSVSVATLQRRSPPKCSSFLTARLKHARHQHASQHTLPCIWRDQTFNWSGRSLVSQNLDGRFGAMAGGGPLSCTTCGTTERLKRCTSCKQVYYCGTRCQKQETWDAQ